MAIDRRTLILALAGAVATRVAGSARAGAAGSFYAAARTDPTGAASLVLFNLEGEPLFTTSLPARGHDCAVSPDGRAMIAFARRPGNWAVVVDIEKRVVTRTLLAAPGRHFYGHGVFSADGRLMIATENALDTGEGVLGIYDVAADYRRIGEVPSGGIGPHDIALLPDGKTLAIANGGIRTSLETGRDILNLDTMQPNLTVMGLDGASATRHELDAALRLSSLRHLAVAGDGTIAFGCQFQGDDAEAPPLVGLLRPGGRPLLLGIPEDENARLQNYIGALAFDRSGDILAATSPKGSRIAFWRASTGAFLGGQALGDVCGVAAVPTMQTFLVTAGTGTMALASATELRALDSDALARHAFDNHLRAITRGA